MMTKPACLTLPVQRQLIRVMRHVLATLLKVKKPDGSLLVKAFSRLPSKSKYAPRTAHGGFFFFFDVLRLSGW